MSDIHINKLGSSAAKITLAKREDYPGADQRALDIATKSKIDFSSFQKDTPSSHSEKKAGKFSIDVAYGPDYEKYRLTYEAPGPLSDFQGVGTLYIDKLEEKEAKPLAKLDENQTKMFLREFIIKDMRAAKKAGKNEKWTFNSSAFLGMNKNAFYNDIIQGITGFQYAIGGSFSCTGRNHFVSNVIPGEDGKSYDIGGFLPEALDMGVELGLDNGWVQRHIVHPYVMAEPESAPTR